VSNQRDRMKDLDNIRLSVSSDKKATFGGVIRKTQTT
jgi:hypothetical protein